jgi:hypothetical protein
MDTKSAKYPICRHIKTNGHRCQSPAILSSVFCYYHRYFLRSHEAASAPKAPPLRPETVQYLLDNGQNPAQFAPSPAISYPPLEDAESIQISISLLFAAIAARQIDSAQARNLLYALQLASFNVRALPPDSAADHATLARHIVRNRHGQPLAAPGEGNGVPCENDPKSALAIFLEENGYPQDEPPKTPKADPEFV